MQESRGRGWEAFGDRRAKAAIGISSNLEELWAVETGKAPHPDPCIHPPTKYLGTHYIGGTTVRKVSGTKLGTYLT